MGTKIQITADCADVSVAMAFWAPALGYVPEPPPPGMPQSPSHGALADPDGIGPRLFFQAVPEPKTAKNRWHLDVEVTDRSQSLAEKEATIAAKVASLVALGATELETIHEGGGTFTVLRDPEDNEICVQ
ncbi:MAG TPA: VOC family protein [Mycobacteriales bacterium]